MAEFGSQLKFLRNANKITQQQLAQELNLKRSTIAGYETNRKEPDFDTLISIANYFNVSTDYLLGTSLNFHECVLVHTLNNNHTTVNLLHELAIKDKEIIDFFDKFATDKEIRTICKHLLKLSSSETNKLLNIIKALTGNEVFY